MSDSCDKGRSKMLNNKTQLFQISPDTCMLMNCYVIKTPSDKLIVIDGGGIQTREETNGYLYNELKNLSGKDIPEIEAWLFSHMHDDHVAEFYKIVQDDNKPIKIKNVYFNFPKRSFFEKAENGRFVYLFEEIKNAYNKLYGECSFEKCDGKTAFTGDVFEIDGIKAEILLTTTEDVRAGQINDSSMIFKLNVGTQTILFLGDAYIDQGNQLLEKYGANLKSDIVQMSHHGQNGVTQEVYEAINPTLCLWPSPDWVFDNWNGNLNTFKTRAWMENIGVKYHLITGRYKTQKIDLPIDFKTLSIEDISVCEEKQK